MPHVQRAFQYFNDSLIEELAELSPQSFLYVGWRQGTNQWWKDHFVDRLRISRVGILDIFEPNYRKACSAFPQTNVMLGDVREIEKHVFKGEYDIIYWDHGPEHVSSTDLAECTPRLYDYAGKALVYSCPWGHWPQGAEDGNVNEIHYDVDDVMLERLGMKLRKLGAPGQNSNGEIVAWWKK